MKTVTFTAERARVLRISQVAKVCHCKTSRIWELASDDSSTFPRAMYVTPSLVVWDEDAVHKWYRAHITLKAKNLGLLVQTPQQLAIV